MADNPRIPDLESRAKFMAKGGYTPEPKAGYSGDVFGILVSLGLIFGGLSGRMVLRGTNSSPALVVAGVVFLILDIVTMVSKKSRLQKAEEELYARNSRMRDQEKAAAADGRAMAGRVNVRIVCDKPIAALDFGPRLNGSPMTRDVKAREYTGTTERVRNIINFNYLDLTAVFDADPYASEIVLDLFRDKTGIGLALPQDARPAEGDWN